MKIEVLPPSSSYIEDDQENLNILLDAFGSKVSLEDIASAYCQAGRNVCATAEILCNKQGSSSATCSSKLETNLDSTTSVSSTHQSNANSEDSEVPKFKPRKTSVSSMHQSNANSEDSEVPKFKPKKSSVSIGTVSGVIGKDYVRHRPQPNGTNEKCKPVKLNSDEFPASEIWDEKRGVESTSKDDSMSNDIEEFLFKMLGSGFRLDMSVIKDVVGQCGYNMQRSIDKLLDLSAATLEKSNGIVGVTAVNTTTSSIGPSSISCNRQSPPFDVNGRSKPNVYKEDEVVEPSIDEKKKDASKEVLEALFCVPGTVEEKQEYTPPIRAQDRRSPYGRVVDEPLKETLIEDFTFITRQPVKSKNDEADEYSYEDLRGAMKEHLAAMKEYYKAAVDSFSRKEYTRAQKLMEKGNFFKEKALEANEKSAQKLVEDSDEDEDISINVHYLDPRDALSHFKLNLTSLSGLPSIRLLKVVVGTTGVDRKDSKRKHLVTKFLEKKGIPWTEEGNGWIISVRVDEIDPLKLTSESK